MKRSRKEIRRRRKVWQSKCNDKHREATVSLIIAIGGILAIIVITLAISLVVTLPGYNETKNISSGIVVSKEEDVRASSFITEVTKVNYDASGNSISSKDTPYIRELVIETEPDINHNYKSTIQEDMEKKRAEDRIQEIMNSYVYHSELSYTEEDLEWLAKIVYCEAGGESSDILQQYVASVVINRANAPIYSNTIEGVIFDKGQYAPAISGKIYNCTYDERSYNNAKYILDNGSILPENVLFQAEFIQGSGIYDTVPIRNGEATMYFCY